MIKKLINLMGGKRHSYKDTNSYRNENGLENFITDIVTYSDSRNYGTFIF